MELHTFSDGIGRMATRHANGGGWIAKPSYWIDNGIKAFIAHGQPESNAKRLHQMLLAFIAMHDCKDE